MEGAAEGREQIMSSEKNGWFKMVGYRGCIYPCSGKPVLRTKQRAVRLAADVLPEWLQCSECGHAPSPKDQPELLRRFKNAEGVK